MTTSVFRLPPRTVGVVVKHSSPDAISLGLRVLDELARRGVAGLVDTESAGALGMPAGPPRASLGRHVDVVLVLGGDGTFLSAAHECPASTPIAGVNLGFLGFLTEHAPARTFELLEAILSGSVEIEQRARLQVRVEGGDEFRSYQVINDVVVTKAALARIVMVCVEVEGELLSRYRGDGLILSTPTGSTAYNLSAGGPIVHPALAAYLITPICPHTLSNRPLAIPTDLRTRVWVEPGAVQAYLTLDGQIGFPMSPQMRVTVGPSGEPLSVIRETSSSFFSILHHKLKWGDREG